MCWMNGNKRWRLCLNRVMQGKRVLFPFVSDDQLINKILERLQLPSALFPQGFLITLRHHNTEKPLSLCLNIDY